MTRPTPKEFFTLDRLRKRRDDRPPPMLFHWTRSFSTAASILQHQALRGWPIVHLTENPNLIEAGSIGWMINTASVLRLGFHIYPSQSKNWPHEAEWVVGSDDSERMSGVGDDEASIWSKPVEIPLSVATKMLVRPHLLRQNPGLLKALRAQSRVPVEEFEWDEWWDAQNLEPNSLLSHPPGRFHKLQNTQRYRKLLGRSPREDDYDGVHTSTSELIAAAYAMSAWRKSGDAAYPVLVTLDVSGLTPLPDVDAELRGAEAADDLISHYRRLVEDGATFNELVEDEGYTEADAQVGEDPAAFVFEDTGHHVLQSIRDYAEAEEQDEEVLFEEFLRTGKLPSGVLTRMVQQQRYMVDFDLNRIVRIEAIKPWWNEVLLGPGDDEEDEKIEEISDKGYYLFTLEDWPFVDPGERKTLYEAPDAAEREHVEYHGTTSDTIASAFPGVITKTTPFPVEE